MQTSLMDKIREMEMESWRLDPEKSHASITITPIVEDGGHFEIDEELEIRPYPNPFGFGGMYGGRGVRSRKEVDPVIKSFKKMAKEWEARGMKPPEVIWQPEMTWADRRNRMMAEMEAKGLKISKKSPSLNQLRLF